MKIAILGAGITGNVAAYELCRDHEITVFEANDYIGGHTHTHDLEWNGRAYAVDSGFIVFNYRTYPEFTRLLGQLGVDVRPSRMSFSVKCERTGLEYSGAGIDALFAQRRNLVRAGFWRMLRDILRFNREAPRLLHDTSDLSLGDFLAANGYSTEFREHYLIPMAAAIWSADPDEMYRFPARFVLRFFDNHGLLTVADQPQWQVISGGSREYVRRLTRPFADRIRIGAPVEAVIRHPHGVQVKVRGQAPERFDHVFIATHSNQALGMLADASPLEREILGAIRYQPNEAVLHTDAAILPRRRSAWAAWNYHVLPEHRGRVAVTYNMNILQGLDAPVQFCVTLNNSAAIDPARVIRTMTYEHPVFSPQAVAAQQRHDEISGVNRTWYCGAYWGNGFHEDGVVSALRAVGQFRRQGDAQLPVRRTA